MSLNLVRRLAALGILAMTVPVVVPAVASADEALSTPASETERIEAVVRDYILNHPEIIGQALDLLRARERGASEALVSEAIESRRDQLLNDPASPTRGDPGADVTIVEFLDYRCGFCRKAYPELEALLARDPNVRIVYKDFPILGPDSVVAARAAIAAARQGRYHDLHDTFYTVEGPLPEARVLRLAEEIGLDMEQLERDMYAPETDAIIERNKALANGLNIRGTPTFVIGDRMIPGYVDGARLAEIIDRIREQNEVSGG